MAGRPVSYCLVDPRKFRPSLALGSGKIGSISEFSEIIKRTKADFAINGAFFDAYSNHKIRNTVQTLISQGRPVNLSDIGCMIGFQSDGRAKIGRVKIRIRGTVAGQSWYAYRINNDPSASASIAMEFNSAWGSETGFDGGLQVQVSKGKVTWVTRTSTKIPTDGYVLFFKGSEEKMGLRFHPGDAVKREITYESDDNAFWRTCEEAVGAGPTLVRNGKVVVDAESEGFRDPKITRESGSRSMIGLKQDGTIVLAVSSGTVTQVAAVMESLGCTDAMNLDGGASSGLFVQGRYVRQAGRPLSNVLVFCKP